MIKITNLEAFNFKGAFRGLRNPMNSWDKSDSYFGEEYGYNPQTISNAAFTWKEYLGAIGEEAIEDKIYDKAVTWSDFDDVIYVNLVGPKDLDLAQRMISAGTSDSKFLRQIFVSMDIEAPLYWWKEFDTYKIGTVANSCSTMHKLASTPITRDCFSFQDFYIPQEEAVSDEVTHRDNLTMYNWQEMLINYCEWLRAQYQETKDEKYWYELVNILPNSWMQKRTWTANYEVLRTIIKQRKYHRLPEWHQFIKALHELPYADELIFYGIEGVKD